MKHIHLIIELTDDNCLNAVSFEHNDSDMPSDSDTLRKLGYTIFKACEMNAIDLAVNDLMNDINNPEGV